MQKDDLKKVLNGLQGRTEFVSLRWVKEKTTWRSVRNDQPDTNSVTFDEGLMVEVFENGHIGYAGTADLSPEGIRRAFDKAQALTRQASARKVADLPPTVRPLARGEFRSPRQKNIDSLGLAELTDFLLQGNKAAKISDKIVNRLTQAMIVETEFLHVASNGSETRQDFSMVGIDLHATAQDGPESQTRTFNGWLARCQQVGAEIFDLPAYLAGGEQTALEALELLQAENCPSDTRDVVLMPDQMILQIHESIGHPLELDRILGDERNYAGWSFVKPEDFGNLQYGSELMNVTFDPTRSGEFASYGFDDGGNPARREHLIQNGRLLRGLGSLESQHRLKLPGVANFRASSWNRAPIDRMANINLEPGTATLEELIGKVEKGLWMTANRSWSIDDYRNKFQFGCEYGKLIENGRLTKTVRNPNYRGTTVAFWNKLDGVGRSELMETYGTPFCGKGEPNQAIRVGHASPPCLFRQVEVFGGAS